MIRIYGLKERLSNRTREVSNVINSVMVDVLKFPDNKRAHRFILLDKTEFFYPDGRSDDYISMEINMMAGREIETKKKLIKEMFKSFENHLGISPVDLEITITEQPPYQWGFRGMTGDEAKLNYKINV